MFEKSINQTININNKKEKKPTKKQGQRQEQAQSVVAFHGPVGSEFTGLLVWPRLNCTCWGYKGTRRAQELRLWGRVEGECPWHPPRPPRPPAKLAGVPRPNKLSVGIQILSNFLFGSQIAWLHILAALPTTCIAVKSLCRLVWVAGNDTHQAIVRVK